MNVKTKQYRRSRGAAVRAEAEAQSSSDPLGHGSNPTVGRKCRSDETV
jgi:hypothetical protein